MPDSYLITASDYAGHALGLRKEGEGYAGEQVTTAEEVLTLLTTRRTGARLEANGDHTLAARIAAFTVTFLPGGAQERYTRNTATGAVTSERTGQPLMHEFRMTPDSRTPAGKGRCDDCGARIERLVPGGAVVEDGTHLNHQHDRPWRFTLDKPTAHRSAGRPVINH